jgi:para-aminobenzoate synthetase/4-amino-4-deoxychorismate lyase
MNAAPKPDPADGLFETLLVVEGAPVELEPHLDRLRASLRKQFDAELPGAAMGLIAEHAAGIELGRLRLTVAPGAAGLGCEVTAEAVDPAICFPDREHGAELRSLPLHGGFGSQKWSDREILKPTVAGTIPLVLDRGDEVLEAGWANVFAAIGGALVTPAADGRILPGIARAATLAVAEAAGIEVEERRLGREELFGAEEVFLTGSVRGLTPARTLDGEPLPGPAGLSRLVADGLRRRWGLAPAAGRGRAPAGARSPGPLAR